MFRNRNGDAGAVLLRSVRLRECENVRGGCDVEMPVDGRLEAGQATDVLTVFPLDPGKPMSFKAWVTAQSVKGYTLRYTSERMDLPGGR